MPNKKAAPPAAKHFDALKALRGQVPTAQRSVARKPQPTSTATPELSLSEAMRGVAPIAAPNRAEIDAPKPAPTPRPKPPEADEPPKSKTGPQTDGYNSFHDAVRDVIALQPNGQIDPEKLGVRRPSIGALQAEAAGTTLSAWLDQAAHPHDPAALFRHAVGPAAPIKDAGRLHLTPPAPPPQPRQREADEQQVLADSIVAPLSFEDRLDIGDEAAFQRPGIPRRVLTDLRRGRWVVQAELDLHGLDREEARSALSRFLAVRLTRGERCVRIIHGKGLGSPGRIGVLKQLSRNWLAQREEILAFCQAKPHDGGEGALLVLLRAPRPTA
ncbi:Smr/MutS family protein [Niveibacterium sp. 24ML]|uniref:Smr/MutS family protein n=1 Tax=Niveibacterium sp. 24ML TaxID=2985512 RepID=UPI00226DFC0E|nr:Smr/MutS family protein [Niveibacterium sp. 24ML]MCX9157181.1 Smr/MutS family protein [Niveibacterium sp. 24ML]